MELLHTIAMPSSWMSRGGPKFKMELGRLCTISIYFDETSNYSAVLEFDGVEAYKCTYYMAIDVSLIEAAYDKVVDLGETQWLAHVRGNLERSKWEDRRWGRARLRHLAVMFDDGPAWEFICRTFSVQEDGTPETVPNRARI